MKHMIRWILFLCVLFAVLAVTFSSHGEETEIVTGQETSPNYIPEMENFTTSGGTNTGGGRGCTSGNFCTAGTQGPGGTYTSTFDLEDNMTIDQINRGFDMDYGVDVESHQSNSVLATCANGNVMQNGDCRDIFNLTVTLLDSDNIVHKFEHEVELDFTGTRSFAFTQVISENNFTGLKGEFELFGIDAGFPSGFFGPRFDNPFLTTTFDLVTLLETEVLNIIDLQENIEVVEIQDIEIETVAPQEEIQVAAEIVVEEIETVELQIEIQQPVEPQAAEEMEVAVEVEQEIEAELEDVSEPEPEAEEVVEESSGETEDTGEANEPAQNEEPAEETAQEEEASEESEPETKKAVAQKVKEKVAKKIMSKMGDKGTYDSTNQVRTLAVMGVLGNSCTFFDTQATLQDTPGFFSSAKIPDSSIPTNNVAQYLMFGGSNQSHSELVDSQWQK
jgi:outer membrane biosynthesis protein TonB